MTALKHGKTMVLYELIAFGLIIEDFWVGVLRNKLERVLEMCSTEEASMG